MLTLFVLLTVTNFAIYLGDAQEVSPSATIHFVSFVPSLPAREDEAVDARSQGHLKQAALLRHIEERRRSLDELTEEVESMDRLPIPPGGTPGHLGGRAPG